MADRSLLRLNELDKDEFRAATRPLWPPHWTEDDFEDAWREFVEIKRRKALN